VQTCALPILGGRHRAAGAAAEPRLPPLRAAGVRALLVARAAAAGPQGNVRARAGGGRLARHGRRSHAGGSGGAARRSGVGAAGGAGAAARRVRRGRAGGYRLAAAAGQRHGGRFGGGAHRGGAGAGDGAGHRARAGPLARGVPVVLDADGLNALAEAGGPERLARGRSGAEPALVLTPHPGEMARLCGSSAADVAARPLDYAAEYARRWGAVVVLKGAPTVVADPRGSLYINSTGSPALASGGSGDVLAGAIGGLIAQGATPVAAAVAGVFLHGAAGDLGFAEPGDTRAFRPHM